MRVLKVLLALALVLMFVVPVASAPINVTYSWTAPTTGSACVAYEVERSLDNGVTWTAYTTTTSTTAVVVAPDLQPIVIRVRGVDSLGRKGVYSASSDPFTNDPGPPGACGKPARIP